MAIKCGKCIIGFEEGYQDEISNLIMEGEYIDLNDKNQIFTTVFKYCPICGEKNILRGVRDGEKIKSGG